MYLVIDTEVSKLPHSYPWDVNSFFCSCGIETEEGEHKTWVVNHVSQVTVELSSCVKQVQEYVNKSTLLVMHNAKFDLAWLRHIGVQVNVPVWCTMIGDYILFGQNPDVELSLNACCRRRNLPTKKDGMAEYWEQGVETNEIPLQIHEEYLAQDVHITKLLFEAQRNEVRKAGLTKIVEYSSNLCRVLSSMEYDGVKFDKAQALRVRQEYLEEAKSLEDKMCEYVGFKFSPTSPKQLQTVLFGGQMKRTVQEIVAKPRKNGTFRVYTRKSELIEERRGLGLTPHVSTLSQKTGTYSTGKQARKLLEFDTDFQRSFIQMLNTWSVVHKAWSTILNEEEDKGWLTKVQADGCLHPTYNQTVTRTGRLSSQNPNGQNLPRSGTSKLKTLFVPRYDYILSCDLSQIEWRMAAALSQDPVMCKEIKNGLDCHTENGEKFFGGDRNHPDFKKKIRQPCKIFNFRMIYDGKEKAFFFDPDMPRKPLEWWKQVVNGFWAKYKVLRSWQKKNAKLMDKDKYLRNVTGRILTARYNANPDEGPIGYKFSKICNYPVQSVSADLQFIVMLEAYKYLKLRGLKSKIILAVHDSLVFDCPKNEVHELAKYVLKVMDDLPNLSQQYYSWTPCVPLGGEATIGRTYGETLAEVNLSTVDNITKVIKEQP